MSIRKKIVFLPYDMDTALGINNEGELVFSYNLEDIDRLPSGAMVFNGGNSVLWKNLRAAFDPEIKAMYRELRNSGALSYSKVEAMFEEHQGKWGEAIFNEDAWFKYIEPFVVNGDNHLGMLQGAKTEQRKWWMYNRFRYMDSRYNAGDALTDFVLLRGYEKADITVIPYADIYASVEYASRIVVQKRAPRNLPCTLEFPLDRANDTETRIFSASQLKSLGDLAPYKIGLGNFASGVNLQTIKIGDADSEYSNGNFISLTLGNNTLLKTLDVRNCPNLSGGIDASHCSNIEHVYFDGTSISGITLPNGGFLKTLHLPGTVTNLTIMNQPQLTDLTIPDYSNITTLRLENVNSSVDARDILADMSAGSRVRLIGFNWNCADYNEVARLYDIFDTMRGLDVNGETETHIQLNGVIHVPSMSESQYLTLSERYSLSINLIVDRIVEERYTITWLNCDGSVLGYSYQMRYGSTPTYYGPTPTNPDPESTDTTFRRWKPDIVPVTGDTTYTASFIPYYTVTFNDGNTTLQTVTGVDRGASAVYTGETPTKTNYEFAGWNPQPTNISGNTTCSAVFIYSNVPETITDSWSEIIENINNGSYLSRYMIGDTKKLCIMGKTYITMRLIGIQVDELEEGGMAPTTWLAIHTATGLSNIYNPQGNKTDGTGIHGGWEHCALRQYINNTVKPLLPYEVRSSLKAVKKYSRGHSMVTNQMANNMLSIDELWIPSVRELGFANQETAGPIYFPETPKYPNDVATPVGGRQDRINLRTGTNDAGIGQVAQARFTTDDGVCWIDGGVYPHSQNKDVWIGFCL